MAKKFAKGDKVAITGGRHKGLVGRITRTTDITTSKNEVEVARKGRPARTVRALNKDAAKLAQPKQTTWAWLWSKPSDR
jgi:ribosomal protein L24